MWYCRFSKLLFKIDRVSNVTEIIKSLFNNTHKRSSVHDCYFNFIALTLYFTENLRLRLWSSLFHKRVCSLLQKFVGQLKLQGVILHKLRLPKKFAIKVLMQAVKLQLQLQYYYRHLNLTWWTVWFSPLQPDVTWAFPLINRRVGGVSKTQWRRY